MTGMLLRFSLSQRLRWSASLLKPIDSLIREHRKKQAAKVAPLTTMQGLMRTCKRPPLQGDRFSWLSLTASQIDCQPAAECSVGWVFNAGVATSRPPSG
jgi:hypothetical protein